MSDQSTNPAEALEVARRADEEVSRLCDGGRWTMRVPVDEERDSDMLMASATNALRSLAAQVMELQAELADIDAVMARRPALDQPTRRGKIAHTISVASKADALAAQVEGLKREAGKVILAFHDWPTYTSAFADSERQQALMHLAEEAGR